MQPVSRRRLLQTAAAGVTTAVTGCAARDTRASEPALIASVTTERRANPRVVDLLIELVDDHGATRLAVASETGAVVFQTQLRPTQRFVRVPLEDGVDAILQPIAAVESLQHEIILYDGETELTRRPWRPEIDIDYAPALRNNNNVDIVNSIRIRLRNNSDIRMRPLRAYVTNGFISSLRETDRVGDITPTTPTWAAGWQRTYQVIAEQPEVGGNLLSPPGGECFFRAQIGRSRDRVRTAGHGSHLDVDSTCRRSQLGRWYDR
ncbi:MAG: hypothetical protein A07HN63_00600 [uncultured archaeon A07HN63]|nr:MAG: hypothetical protein A07HN63_00600 [uncultured archaeon A07HN63]